MKRSIVKWATGLATAIGLALGASCSFPAQDTQNVSLSDISAELSYANISRQAYMGGSVLYNAGNAASGHLANGVTVAVRLGQTVRTDIDSEQAVFDDIEEKACYGYLKIDSINENAVSFTYIAFNGANNNLSEKSFSLTLDEKADLNGDGLPDVIYQKPAKLRQGFEKATWLTFLSSQEKLNTAMYAVLPNQYARNVYPSGLIGINNNGRFIYNKYETAGGNRAAIQGMTFGDFVLDSESGAYQCFVGNSSYANARSVEDTELVTFDDEEQASFYYDENEFDSFTTPKALFDALPMEITAGYSVSEKSAAEIVSVLNEILQCPDLLDAVILQKNLSLTAEDEQNLATAKTYAGDAFVEIARTFIDDVYAEYSPSVLERSTTINNVLPLASVIITDIVDENKLEDDSSRAITVSEYNTKKASIEKQFSDNYKTLKNINLGHVFKDAGAEISLKDSCAKIGVMGDFHCSWGNIRAKVGGAVLLKVNADLSASKEWSTGIPEINLGVFYFPVFEYGPISLNVKGSADFSCPVYVKTSADVNMNAGVTGLYGADVSCGASYGIKWKKKWFIRYPKPYCSFSGDRHSVNTTVYYIDSDSKNIEWSGSSYLSATPTFKLFLGANLSYVVDVGITAKPGLKPSLLITYANNARPRGDAKIEGIIGIDATAGIGITVPIIGHIGKSWSFDLVSPRSRTLASWRAF